MKFFKFWHLAKKWRFLPKMYKNFENATNGFNKNVI